MAGRPRSYDREEVLERAMTLFWEKGFEGAHLGELVEVTGLNRFSLYKEFGGKEGLFRDALSRSSRKPFQCGGLQGYDQLVGISQHLSQRRTQSGPDPYLDQVHHDVQCALRATASQAEGVRQARTFLTQVEHYLASLPRPSLDDASAICPQPSCSPLLLPHRQRPYVPSLLPRHR